MSSKELMDGLVFVKDILIKPFYDENGEGRRIRYVIDMKDNFLQGSQILKSVEEIDLIKEWTNKNYLVTELIFRASKDGFTASSFHSKVNDKGPTIILIKSKNGNVFGGYTGVSWTSSGQYCSDSNTFLFSVTKKAKLE